MAINIPKPIVLVILDGFGIAPSWGGNAISEAKMPTFTRWWRQMPHSALAASGEAVGLPDSEEGNSEVGHLNIGTGIAIEQDVKRINRFIETKQFFTNPVLKSAFEQAKYKQKNIHLLGIISHGGVHGSIEHLLALLELAKIENCSNVFLHLFTDGRDSDPYDSLELIAEIERKISEVGIGRIVSIIGRYYAMDRDHRWDRTEKAYDLVTQGIGSVVTTPEAAISKSYREGFSDEFVPPYSVRQADGMGLINDGDTVIFYNYRGDRARQLCLAFLDPKFDGFARKKVVAGLNFVTFTSYKEDLPAQVAFPHDGVEWPLAAILAHHQKPQLHLAETEKYAHVTYFFDGGHEKPFPLEDRILVPSPKVATYDLKPSMSAEEITAKLLEAIQKKPYEFIVVNYANPDMVGHSGDFKAIVVALECVDKQLETLEKAILPMGGMILLTADHGNCEEAINPSTGAPSTDHSDNPVPFIMVSKSVSGYNLQPKGKLSDIAPTILQLMQLPVPTTMTGRSLLVE